jgi:ATP-dependent Clp protease, protease subunit
MQAIAFCIHDFIPNFGHSGLGRKTLRMMYQNDFEKFAVKDQGISGMTMHRYSNAVANQFFGMTPNIIEERKLNIAMMDVFSRLMMDRIIFMGMEIDDVVSNIIVAQLLYLDSTNKNNDISIYVNSPGGSVYDGMAIYDTMQIVQPDVATICVGMAASMGAVLLCAGSKGKRTALPHSRVMIHQPMSGTRGQASDIAIANAEVQKLKAELYGILSHHSGQPIEKIEKDSDRDYWMIAEEAREYGLIDEVLKR